MMDREFLEESATRGLVELLMDERGMTLTEALGVLSNSRTLDRLLDEETGLYRESPAYIFEILSEELAE